MNYQYSIKDPICKRRARFAVEEEERTKKAVQALKKDDLVLFGQLINASGDGLKNDYDATCKEIDILVEEARKQEGCLGSRETGGGCSGRTWKTPTSRKPVSMLISIRSMSVTEERDSK